MNVLLTLLEALGVIALGSLAFVLLVIGVRLITAWLDGSGFGGYGGGGDL